MTNEEARRIEEIFKLESATVQEVIGARDSEYLWREQRFPDKLGVNAAVTNFAFDVVAQGNEYRASQVSASAPIGGSDPGLDLTTYKTRRAWLLFVPRLALMLAAIVLVFSLAFSIRASLMLLTTYVIPMLRGSSGEVWEVMSGLANMTRGMIGIIALIFAPLYLAMSLIPLLYCRAFFNFSPAAAIVSILLLLPVVALFNYNSPDIVTRVVISAVGPAAIFAVYFGLARLVFRDRLGNALLNARRSAPIEELYRYGFSQLRRTAANALIFAAKLAVPLLVLVLAFAVHGLSQLASLFDPSGAAVGVQLILLLLLLFIARPYAANAIRACFRDLKRRNAESATFVYSIDKRPRILLLRSFRDDEIKVPVKRSYDQVIYGVSSFYTRLEELLVHVSYRYGPVGALQDPKLRLRPLGAARDLSSDGDWQSYVENAISRAAIIMFVVDDTAGLGWEIEKIKSLRRLNDTILIFPPKSATGIERSMEIARRILGDRMPVLQTGMLPVVAFCDNARKWQLVTSNEQGAIDYQEGLTLAYQLQPNATARRASTNYSPALKIGAVAAACVALVGYQGIRNYAVYSQEEEFNSNWHFPNGDVASVIDQYRKRIEWAEAEYPKSMRDSHIYERFASSYSQLAGVLDQAKRYDEAIASIAKSNANARLSAEHSDDRSRSLIQLSDNAELHSRIMVAMGDSAIALLDESITLSQDVAVLRTTQRYYRRKLADRLRLRGKIRLDAGLFGEALTDYEAAWDAFNVDLEKRVLKPDGDWDDKSESEGEEKTEMGILSTLGYVYFYAGQFEKAEEFLGRLWERDHKPYQLLFMQIARLKRGLGDAKWLKQRAQLIGDRKWPYPMVEMYLGGKSIEAAAAEAVGKDQQCEADFYIGEFHLAQSQMDKAVGRLKAAVATCPHTFIEHHGGLAELRRLGK